MKNIKRDNKIRGLWHRPNSSCYNEKTLEGIRQLLKEIKKAGFNIVFLETYFNGYFSGKSEILETHPKVLGGDYLQYKDDYLLAFTNEARILDIEVHAWMHCLNAGNSNYLSKTINEGWLLEDYNGCKLHPNEFGGSYFLDPSNEEVLRYLKMITNEIITKYSVQGIQIDYIRYEENSGYGNLSEKKFQNDLGICEDVRSFCKSKDGRELWKIWKCKNINLFVDELSKYIEEINNEMIISAAVIPSLEEAKEKYMQDIVEWTKKGKIDFICPMIYTDDVEKVYSLSKKFKNIFKDQCLIVSAIAPLFFNYSQSINSLEIKAALTSSDGIGYFASANIFNSANRDELIEEFALEFSNEGREK